MPRRLGARRAALSRPILELLEGDADPRAGLAFLAGTGLELDESAVKAACRRALLLLASGGDPRRPLDLDGRAVRSLADELRVLAPALDDALAALEADAADLPTVGAALAELRGGAGYRWLAVGILADELADEGD